ncbi:MAG: Txe/YoeB family addiction module toxin, partial [Bacteroidales bacterium]|nr:Txe/YoeB family addiction module toxin [Bacteroidales bacterium]
SGNKQALKKITQLLSAILIDYKSGIGQPEPLKNNMTGFWSRHIDKKNRLIYEVYEEDQIINVISLRGHYSDK